MRQFPCNRSFVFQLSNRDSGFAVTSGILKVPSFGVALFLSFINSLERETANLYFILADHVEVSFEHASQGFEAVKRWSARWVS